MKVKSYNFFALFFLACLVFSRFVYAEDVSKIKVDNKDGIARFGTLITVTVDEQTYKATFEGENANKTPVLYLNTLPIKGLMTTKIPTEHAITFQLSRTNDSFKEWTAILKKDGKYQNTKFLLGVGLDQGEIDQVGSLPFEIIPGKQLAGWGFISLVILALVIYCPDMLKDSAPNGTTVAYYSLGRIQMAFWFVLVTIAFLFIWMVTGDAAAIPNSALSLIGISAGTALGAAAIGTASAPPTTQTSSINCSAHCKLLNDILTDPSGKPSFHRLQMLIWTFVMGIIFVTDVATTLSMPDFPSELLALMGISSGTYLGFKIPENSTAPTAAPAAAPVTTAAPAPDAPASQNDELPDLDNTTAHPADH